MISDFLKTRAKLTPDKIALKEYIGDKSRSFSQLEKNAHKLAASMKSIGVVKGDRIGALCRNRIEFFETLFACAKLGAILVPFNWRSPPDEILPLYETIAPKILFYGVEDAQNALQIVGANCAINYDDGYQDFLEIGGEFKARDFWPDDECWYLIFTSGTTGKPKAVIQTYRMALANAVNIGQAIGITLDDRFLNFLPLFHTAGINLHTLPALMNGCMSWVISGFDAKIVLDLVDRNDLSCFFGVPQVYLLLSQHEDFEKTNIKNMRNWGCGGAPLPNYLVETFAARGALVCNGMGMTETGPTVFMMDKENVLNKIGSVGKSQVLTIARVVDDEFNDCKPNQEGHLVFAGPNISPGYWNNPIATQETFHTDANGVNWLKSGDLARIDEDGYYYLVGRSKEMFISGGENVYPAEVENALLGHEDIIEAAIIGVADEKWGEVGVAFLSARRNIETAELIAFCRSKLAPFKIPKKFIFVDDYPRTAAGKIQKHILKKEYENGN